MAAPPEKTVPSDPPVTAAKSNPDERVFLEGPRRRRRELWSVVEIALEFIRGFRALHFVGPVRDRLRLGAIHGGPSLLRLGARGRRRLARRRASP